MESWHRLYVLVILTIGGVIIPANAQKSAAMPGLAQLQKMTDRFAPTPMRVDTSKLSSGDQQALSEVD